MNNGIEIVQASLASLESTLNKLSWSRGAWRNFGAFPFSDFPRVDLQLSRDIATKLLADPTARAAGNEDYWRGLAAVGTSFTDFVFMPGAQGMASVREAMTGWLTYFWHLDTVVDEYRDQLPDEDTLRQLRGAVEKAWLNADASITSGQPRTISGKTGNLADLAMLFFGWHSNLLSDTKLPKRALASYWSSVAEHIQFQLSPTWLYRRFDDFDQYMHCRTRQSGMECIIMFALALATGEPPPEARSLIDLTNKSTSLINDLFSYQRDLSYGTPNGAMFIQNDDVVEGLCEKMTAVNDEILTCAHLLASNMEPRTWSRLVGTMSHVLDSVVRWHFVEPRYSVDARIVLDFLDYRGEVPWLRTNEGLPSSTDSAAYGTSKE